MDVLMLLLILGAAPVAQQPRIDHAEQNCLASNVYYEARGESLQGQQAVAQVTLNRVKSKKYPKTICAVVMQKHQFSWTKQIPKEQQQKALNGYSPQSKQQEVLAYVSARKVAVEALSNKSNHLLPETVLWYHTKQVNPVWNKQMKQVSQVGNHVFYEHKTKGKI
jgi:spore germination cell wall hydrolase CwlJ-like protein